MKCENGTVAKCYGLPKIHKEQLTYRIIISSINFPTYKLARFLSDILVKVVGKTNSYVKDSWSFYDDMKDIIIPNNYKMISLDVVSLFTNVPLELVSEIINEKWSDISTYTKLTKSEIIKALKLVFNNTVFSFDKIFYEQKYGCPMGSPLSPVIANLVMEKIEGIALSKLTFEPIMYKRYVDDIFTIVPECFVDEMVDVFNSIHNRIKFTKEVELEGELSFLDIKIIKNDDNRVKLNWYRKPTWSGRFLNFDSHHQFGNKIGTVKGVIDRAIKLSHKDFRKDNLDLIRKTFVNNNYPIDFINKMIEERVNEIYNGSMKKRFNLDVKKGVYFVLPYVRGLSERLKVEFKKHNIQIFFRNNNNLSRFFNNCKDKDEKDMKSGIVYKINCKCCNKYYIGQSGRYLKKRIYEHKYSLRSPNITSGLKQHCLDCIHSFDFENVEILECGIKNKFKRESLENIHIFMNKNNVNLMLESSKLDKIYYPFLK